MEMQILEFFHLVFSLSLVQYFLTMLSFLHFEIIMYILCHYMLNIYYRLLYFDFYRGLQLRDYMNLRREFEILNKFETVVDYGCF